MAVVIGHPEVSHAVILAAGAGTRMRPWTEHMPKAMLPLGRRPVISFAIDEVRENMIWSLTVVTSPASDLGAAVLRQVVADEWGDASFASQFRQYPGTAMAVLSAFHPKCSVEPDEPFVVMLADDVLRHQHGSASVQLARMIHAYVTHPDPVEAVVCVARVDPDRAHRYGIVEVEDDSAGSPMVVERIEEKPRVPASDLAIVGRYVLGPGIRSRMLSAAEVHAPVPPTGVELTWALGEMVDSGATVLAVELDHREVWYDTGNVEGYAHAFAVHARMEIEGEE